MCYSTQEMFLDRKREVEHHNRLYQEAEAFHKLADNVLKQMKANEFKKMLEAQENLKKLKENKVAEELNQVKLQHQRVLMEVQEIYGRFQYLLKLISYFDDTLEQQSEQLDNKLTMPEHIINMEISERHPAGLEQVQQVKEYMEHVIRPYLEKRNHLNADIWIKGYERNRLKVSNYNKRFTQLALLNHIVCILHDKAVSVWGFLLAAQLYFHLIAGEDTKAKCECRGLSQGSRISATPRGCTAATRPRTLRRLRAVVLQGVSLSLE